MKIRLCEATIYDINRRFGNNIRKRRSKSYKVRVKEYTINPLYIVFEVTGGTHPYEVDLAFKDVNPKSKRAIENAIKNNQILIGCSCLHPDTRVKLLDGTSPTVKELKERFDNGEKLYIYSTDENGDFEPGEIENVWITKQTKEFVKITLDNDEQILTTPDHLYMMRDGSYVEAQYLKPRQSLMPMYFREDNGYTSVYGKANRGWHSVYKKVANTYYPDLIRQKDHEATLTENKLPYNVAIHHKDFNKHNNVPENLQVMTAMEHWLYHASLTFENLPKETQDKVREVSRQNAIKRNANPTERMIEWQKEWCRRGKMRNYDDDRRQMQSEIWRKTQKEYWANMSDEERERRAKISSEIAKKNVAEGKFNTEKCIIAKRKNAQNLHTPENEKKTLDGIHRYWENLSEEDRTRRNAITRANARKGSHKVSEKKKKFWENLTEEQRYICGYNSGFARTQKRISQIIDFLSSNGIEISLENISKYAKEATGIGIYQRTIDRYYTSLDDLLDKVGYDKNYNHKIKSVEFVRFDNDIPVYDISVPKWHNFVVDAGVVLHNCSDFRYRFSFNANKNGFGFNTEHRPAKITNPNDSLGPACKHVAAVLDNLSWVSEVANGIKEEESKEKERAK